MEQQSKTILSSNSFRNRLRSVPILIWVGWFLLLLMGFVSLRTAFLSNDAMLDIVAGRNYLAGQANELLAAYGTAGIPYWRPYLLLTIWIERWTHANLLALLIAQWIWLSAGIFMTAKAIDRRFTQGFLVLAASSPVLWGLSTSYHAGISFYFFILGFSILLLTRPGWGFSMAAGLVGGVLCGFPQGWLFLGGASLVLILQRNWLRFATWLLGLLPSLIVYACILFSQIVNMKPILYYQESWLANMPWNVLSAFRYWALEAPARLSMRLNYDGYWALSEDILGWMSLVLKGSLLIGIGFLFFRKVRKKELAVRNLPFEVQFACIGMVAYVLFVIITNSAPGRLHVTMPMWWAGILLLAWSSYTLVLRKWTARLMGALVGFNILCLVVQFGPRVWVGTTTEPFAGLKFPPGQHHEFRGAGPSWWEQDRIALELMRRVDEQKKMGLGGLLSVKVEQIFYLDSTLELYMKIRWPEYMQWIKNAPPNINSYDLFISRDPEKSHRLTILERPLPWHISESHQRYRYRIVSELPLPIGYPIALFPEFPLGNVMAITTASGKKLPFWPEPAANPTVKPKLWVRVGDKIKDDNELIIYLAARPPLGMNHSRPEDVFPVFLGFGEAQSISHLKLPAATSLTSEGLVNKSDATGSQAKVPFWLTPSPGEHIAIEALVFVSSKTGGALIEGVTFEDKGGKPPYAWVLSRTAPERITLDLFELASDRAINLAQTNWLHFYEDRWHLLRAEILGKQMRFGLDQKLRFDIYVPDWTQVGRVGIAKLNGSAEDSVIVRWLRIRPAMVDEPVIRFSLRETRDLVLDAEKKRYLK